MKKIISVSLLGLGISLTGSAFALNNSTLVIKNYTKESITVKIFDMHQQAIAQQNILKNDQTAPTNWVSSKWIWENDYFDSVDVFYIDNNGQAFNCGTIEPQMIPWGTTVHRAVYIKQCDAQALRYTFLDGMSAR
jgi:hypothetical protein